MTVSHSQISKFTLATVIYYYLAMLISLLVFYGGTNLATHGLLRTTSPDRAKYATCLPLPAPRVIDPSHISAAEQACRDDERNTQIRQGTFQIAQGLVMAIIAGLIFSWHLRRIRKLELHLKQRQ